MTQITKPDNRCYPEKVDNEWLSQVLAYSGHNGVVRSFTKKNIGTGQVGQNVRFELDYASGNGPSSLVGKFASDDPVSRQTGIAVNDYLKEVLYYQQIEPTVDIRTPKIYFSAINLDQADEFVLMMEDLTPGVQGDQLAGCNADQAALAITELAGLAGPRWCDPTLKDIEWLAPTMPADNPRALWDMVCPGFLERYGDKLKPEHARLVTDLGEKFHLYNGNTPDKFTLVHIDYRLDNMMFGGPYPITVVDWSPSIGTGGADAAYFMGTGMDAAPRAACEVDVLKQYHQRLKSYGVDNYTFDECWNDYRLSSFAGLVMAVIASMIVNQTERGDEMFMTMLRRSADMALHLDGLDLLK